MQVFAKSDFNETFAMSFEIAVSDFPEQEEFFEISGIAIGDMEASSKEDLVLVTREVVRTLRYTGGGSDYLVVDTVFDEGNVGTRYAGAAVANFAGDSRDDVVINDRTTTSQVRLLQYGDAGFEDTDPAFIATAGPVLTHIVTADIEPDGVADVIVPRLDFDNPESSLGITVLWGTGVNGDPFDSQGLATEELPFDVVVGDFDGDGDGDLAISHFGPDVVPIGTPPAEWPGISVAESVWIYEQTAPREFMLLGEIPVADRVGSMIYADFDCNGTRDLLVASATEGALYLLRGDPEQPLRFVEPEVVVSDLNLPLRVLGYDLDDDGRRDIVVAEAGEPSVTVIYQD
jgi:hypothetical protein